VFDDDSDATTINEFVHSKAINTIEKPSFALAHLTSPHRGVSVRGQKAQSQ
jgi:hypothetical protein